MSGIHHSFQASIGNREWGNHIGLPLRLIQMGCLYGFAPGYKDLTLHQHGRASRPCHVCAFFPIYFPDPALRTFSIYSWTFTGTPPWRLLSSAASMKANISMVSCGWMGGTPDLKNSMISTTSGA